MTLPALVSSDLFYFWPYFWGFKLKLHVYKYFVIMELRIIQKRIFDVRGHKVMFDKHLAELYGVPTKSLNLAVKRNISRFPSDFMFQLSKREYKSLRFQIETSKQRGGTRYLPHVFTEHGVAMLSSVLRSKKNSWHQHFETITVSKPNT